MQHIKQRSAGVYTFVVGANGEAITTNLATHPSIVEHPEKFEIVDGPPPEGAQELRYDSSTSPAID